MGMALSSCSRRFLGTPWKHQGRHPTQGLDCAGVVVLAARGVGLHLRDRLGYPLGRKLPIGALATANGVEVLPPAQAVEGDVLVFWLARRGHLQHMALRTDVGIIHAVADFSRERRHAFVGGVVQEEPLDAWWKKRALHTYRLPLAPGF